jgi:four helix bundle protein
MREGRGSRVEGRGYQQLLAWQRAHQLALAVFRTTQSLASRDNWLRSQCNRAAVSIAANIAEGYNRGSAREYVQFLTIARGSLAEVEYYVLFPADAELVAAGRQRELDQLVGETGRLLLGLIRSIRTKDGAQRRDVRRTVEAPVNASVLDPRPPTLDPTDP